MVNVSLHGKLGKEFDNSWDLEISNGAELLRALDSQIAGFKDYIVKKETEGARYYIAIDGEALSSHESFLCNFPKKTKKIDFLPIPAGGAPALPFLAEVFKYVLVAVITGLIVNKLFAPPDPEELKESNSYLFAGPVNVEQQGIPVPIAYGTLLIGGKVISAINRHKDTRDDGGYVDWRPDDPWFHNHPTHFIMPQDFDLGQGVWFNRVVPGGTLINPALGHGTEAFQATNFWARQGLVADTPDESKIPIGIHGG